MPRSKCGGAPGELRELPEGLGVTCLVCTRTYMIYRVLYIYTHEFMCTYIYIHILVYCIFTCMYKYIHGCRRFIDCPYRLDLWGTDTRNVPKEYVESAWVIAEALVVA